MTDVKVQTPLPFFRIRIYVRKLLDAHLAVDLMDAPGAAAKAFWGWVGMTDFKDADALCLAQQVIRQLGAVTELPHRTGHPHWSRCKDSHSASTAVI